ncbi:unnamed protein product [Sphagnum compactum]
MMRYRVIGNGLPLLLLLLLGSLNPSFVRRETFRSPAMIFRPGDAKDKFFAGEVPKGHIGVRDFFAEFVDEDGVSVPLHEVYLHHWVMVEFVLPKKNLARHMEMVMRDMRNSHTPSRAGDDVVTLGRRHGHHHHHHHHHHDMRSERPRHPNPLNYMGVGGETRGTETRYPAPFAMETGATAKIPKDFEAVWILNVHGIDTRGAVTKIGCTECRCDLYNVTTTEKGDPLPEGYMGGLHCCSDERRCAVEEGFVNGPKRTLYLQYTWEYVEWDACVVPTTLLGIDVTDKDGSGDGLIEYTVEGSCGAHADPQSEECVDTQDTTVIAPFGGKVVTLVSHLHLAALDSSLWGEDGRLICNSPPVYGHGTEAGNEDGYIIGVGSCYPAPGSPGSRIIEGERLHYQVKYSKVDGPHTGVMGLLAIRMVRDEPQNPTLWHSILTYLNNFVSWISESWFSPIQSL